MSFPFLLARMHLLEFIDNPCPRHTFVKHREPCQLIITLWLELVSPEEQLWEVPLISFRARDGTEPACLSVTSCQFTNTRSPSDRWPVHIGSSSHVSLWHWAFVHPVYYNVYLLGDFKLLSVFPPCFVPALCPSFFFCSPFLFHPLCPFRFLLNILLKGHMLTNPGSDREKTNSNYQNHSTASAWKNLGKTNLSHQRLKGRYQKDGICCEIYFTMKTLLWRRIFFIFFPWYSLNNLYLMPRNYI